MPLNADQLLVVFPHPVLNKIVGETNLASIMLKQSEHNGNLASIKSNLGDGLTGLMVLSMKPDIFKTIHPDTFVIPTNPVPAPDPVVIAAAYTATNIADIYKAYALESAIYSEFVTSERISVKLALDSMSELYYKMSAPEKVTDRDGCVCGGWRGRRLWIACRKVTLRRPRN